MIKRVWFHHGKIIKDGFYCPWCDMHRTGTIIRDRYLWRCMLNCGHVRANLGLTQPYEELERKGLINQETSEDPRYTAKKKQAFREFMNKIRERNERNESLLVGSTIYL